MHDNVQQMLNVDATTLKSHKQQLVCVLGCLQQTMIFMCGVIFRRFTRRARDKIRGGPQVGKVAT